MSRRTRTRSAGMILFAVLVATFVASPVLAVRSDTHLGGVLRAAHGIAIAGRAANLTPNSSVVRRPDGRIRLTGGTGISGAPGPYVGNNIYNTTGAHQTVTMHYFNSFPGDYLAFGISIQNDGSRADRFKVKASGTATNGWNVRYLHGTTNITSAVVGGTYRTPSLAPTGTYLITAKATWVGPYAPTGISRLVTITSAANAAKKDAVKIVLVLDHP